MHKAQTRFKNRTEVAGTTPLVESEVLSEEELRAVRGGFGFNGAVSQGIMKVGENYVLDGNIVAVVEL